MKNRSSKWLFKSVMLLMLAITANAQRSDSDLKRCASAELDSIRIAQNPDLLLRRQKSEEVIQEHIHQHNARIRTSAEAVIIIPVVVHIVHNRSDTRIGGLGNSNISEEQIQSQINVLNEDYSNTSGRKGFYTDSLSVDTGIRFRLAGIVRKFTPQENFDYRTADKQLAAISPPWATNRYLNIWVCNFSSGYLGLAQMPSIAKSDVSVPGIRVGDEEDTDPLTDGVIIDWRYFGRDLTGSLSGIYNLGRTTTHEVGHWLGLLHIWGNRICGTDYCEDTPRARDRNLSTDLKCEPKYSDCDGSLSRDMIENYMDYSPDACMSIFTNDQKNRMRAVLAVSPRRAQLVEHTGRSESNLVVDLYPNPVEGYLNTNIYSPDYDGFEISIFNNLGAEMLKGAYNQTYINVKNFPAGVYFLKVATAKETVTKRFLVR